MGTGSPPFADTRARGEPGLRPNTIVPSSLHVPPPNSGDVDIETIVVTDPSARLRRFSVPWAKNPMDRPSGDQNGEIAFSVLGSGCAVAASSERSHSLLTLSDRPEKATVCPSGERATDESRLGGVLISSRISRASVGA